MQAIVIVNSFVHGRVLASEVLDDPNEGIDIAVDSDLHLFCVKYSLEHFLDVRNIIFEPLLI